MAEASAGRRLIRGLFYTLYLLVVSEVVLQGAYYLSVGQPLFRRVALDWYRPSEVGNFRVKPNLSQEFVTSEFRTHLRTNSEGFRVPTEGREYQRPKPEDVFRILLIGPSFAFAAEVDYEATVGFQVERMLREAGYGEGRRIELINAGVPAWPPLHQLAWFEAEGVSYQPDLVIQFAYGSLVVNPAPPWREITPDGYLVDEDTSTLRRIRASAKKSGIVYYAWLASTRASSFLEKRARARSGQDPEPGKRTIEGAGRELALQDEFDPAESDTARSIEFYRRFREVAEAGGAKMLFVHFPLSYCIHREDIARWRHLGVENVDGQIAFNDDFCRYLDERGIRCLNTTGELARAAESDPERLYYEINIHFTERGNLELARSIARYIRALPAKRSPSPEEKT